jgi:MOSC domain-containing protein YiiM
MPAGASGQVNGDECQQKNQQAAGHGQHDGHMRNNSFDDVLFGCRSVGVVGGCGHGVLSRNCYCSRFYPFGWPCPARGLALAAGYHGAMPASTSLLATVLSVQRAAARRVRIGERNILTGIFKLPVDGPVAVGRLGLDGDEQADLSVHGGLDKAVYAYPSEHYAFWRAERAQAGVAGIDDALPYGALGENLSLQGLLEKDVWVGDQLVFAHCVLQVSAPRQPCYKFNAAMGYNQASRQMAQSGFCGFYLSVAEPGTIAAGETAQLLPGPRRMGIAELFAAHGFKHLR